MNRDLINFKNKRQK